MSQINSRFKKPVLLGIKIISVLIFLISFDWQYRKVIFPSNKHQLATSHRRKAAWVSEGKLIDTPGCSLPKTLFFPDGFSMTKDFGPNCNNDKRLVAIDYKAEVLKLTEEGKRSISPNESGCTFFEIHRKPFEDTFLDSKVVTRVTKTDSIDIKNKELFATQCGEFINYDAYFPLNKIVGDKVAYWNSYRSENKESKKSLTPISVLLIGFDSISRSNFHRSLDKTLPLLKRMGFVDFKGYHSIAPNTLSNFYAFLMGLTKAQLRRGCAPHRLHPFDNCPLIWSDFDRNHFVTMYTEDSDQSFNWGGRGGFLRRPTDYYTHPLFASLQNYTKENLYHRKDERCLSTINSPHFLLDYTKRFLKKVIEMKTPFFSLTWFAYPFHDNTYSLHGLDDTVKEFFQFLNSAEARELRQSTLIILNSDHGERYGDFIHKGYYEGFIERSLPGLFMRLPENLLKEFPELKLAEAMEINSQRLTSGFDIHHTFLHLFALQGLNITRTVAQDNKTTDSQVEFIPVQHDRSSLFLPVRDDRTCSDINIPSENCVCMKTTTRNGEGLFPSSADIDFENNPQYFFSLVDFAVGELNKFVMYSNYWKVCKDWARTNDSFVSWNVFCETDTYAGGVLRFVTNLNKAEFDVQLKVNHGSEVTDIDSIERISSFNRLNRYGNLSWCVNSESDGDRKMKELCYCKEREETKSELLNY